MAQYVPLDEDQQTLPQFDRNWNDSLGSSKKKVKENASPPVSHQNNKLCIKSSSVVGGMVESQLYGPCACRQRSEVLMSLGEHVEGVRVTI